MYLKYRHPAHLQKTIILYGGQISVPFKLSPPVAFILVFNCCGLHDVKSGVYYSKWGTCSHATVRLRINLVALCLDQTGKSVAERREPRPASSGEASGEARGFCFFFPRLRVISCDTPKCGLFRRATKEIGDICMQAKKDERPLLTQARSTVLNSIRPAPPSPSK